MVILKLIILSVVLYISLLLIYPSDAQVNIFKSHNITSALNQSTEISCITSKHLDGCIVVSLLIEYIYIYIY